ncbi:MAG: DNA double-strand break repair Rad50 ATPase [Methanosaeta sp. PtaU1.Bin060]|nr:MAG: DNA double-strand break repair Rad50 ATPase [Methanosaeta sp. PtaU1.Bin060]
MYIKYLHIKNFRCIEELNIEFNKGLNIIIGSNNCGKTAILDTLRLALGIGNFHRNIYVSIEDFYIDEFGKRRDNIEIDAIFSEVGSEEKGIFIEMLRLNSDGTFALELHVRYSIELRNGLERIRTKYWGGEKEGSAIPAEILELFYYIYLEALRDAEENLGSNKGNRLGQLFMRLVPKKEDQESHAKRLYESSRSDTQWVELLTTAGKTINTHLNEITTANRNQEIGIDFIPLSFRRIVDGLKVFIPLSDKGKINIHNSLLKEKGWEDYFINPRESIGERKLKDNPTIEVMLNREDNPIIKEKIKELLKIVQKFELFQNGLGYNNIIYIATVLGDLIEMKTRSSEIYLALLIEEPEAHLHPQLQNLLFDYFEQITKNDIQVFLTSHSPTITAKTDIDNIMVVNNAGRLDLIPLREIDFIERKHKRYLQRFLDVTKSQLFFADSIIFVEGLAEAILLHLFAEILDKNLDKNGVEVVNIEGVAFEPFAKLIRSDAGGNGIGIRCAILSDDDQENGTISDRANKLKGLKNDLLEVYLAERTFEYELLKENEAVILDTYKQLHPRFEAKGSLDEKWDQLIKKLKSNKDKGAFAQQLALNLEESEKLVNEFKIPQYIIRAISWVVDGER